jgi:hypothetical protein
MGILGDLFVVGYCFWPEECDIVQMVVEIGAALCGPRFSFGGNLRAVALPADSRFLTSEQRWFGMTRDWYQTGDPPLRQAQGRLSRSKNVREMGHPAEAFGLRENSLRRQKQRLTGRDPSTAHADSRCSWACSTQDDNAIWDNAIGLMLFGLMPFGLW